MYIPAHFAEKRPDELQRIIHDNPLGILVHQSQGSLDADHIPFEFDPAQGSCGVLTAHIARANPLWRQCPTGTPVMVIFRGIQAYISPNGYPGKPETHRYVPTWNYEVVHAHGILTIHDDERFVRRVVAHLTRRHESSETKPWKMGDAPADFLDEQLRQIIGLEITLTSITGKVKISQNRTERDRQGAADHLEAQGKTEMAMAMRSVDTHNKKQTLS